MCVCVVCVCVEGGERRVNVCSFSISLTPIPPLLHAHHNVVTAVHLRDFLMEELNIISVLRIN